jgi:hypothetical protein
MGQRRKAHKNLKKRIKQLETDIEAVEGSDDPLKFKKLTKLRRELENAEISADYMLKDPKSLNYDQMLEILGMQPSSDTAMDTKYREKIKSPITAIRAFCISCQGDIPGVNDCATFNCPFWPFRMGKNPFFRKLNVDENADIEDYVEEPVDADTQAQQ